jgi:RNA-directed DNA polymerase
LGLAPAHAGPGDHDDLDELLIAAGQQGGPFGDEKRLEGSGPFLLGAAGDQVLAGAFAASSASSFGYWATRRRKVKPPLDSYTVRLLTRQDGRCTLCGENLLVFDQQPQSPAEWERWHL